MSSSSDPARRIIEQTARYQADALRASLREVEDANAKLIVDRSLAEAALRGEVRLLIRYILATTADLQALPAEVTDLIAKYEESRMLEYLSRVSVDVDPGTDERCTIFKVEP